MFWQHTKLAILWAVVIGAMSVAPGDRIPSVVLLGAIGFDKLAHALFYGILTLLASIGLRKQNAFPAWAKRASRLAIGFSMLYGMGLELVQGLLLSDRMFEPLDILANGIGCTLGWLTYRAIYFNLKTEQL